MNDFTKEELLQIEESLSYWFQDSDSLIMDEAKPCYEKIQAMIENYCEHKHYEVGDL